MVLQRYSSEIIVERSPTAVYEMITDITRMGEWSPICRACWWDSGEGPTLGSQFTGHNETDDRTWETRCRVVVADPGREFAWLVEDSVRWGYTMQAVDDSDQACTLAEHWHLFDSGVDELRRRYGKDADAELEMRGVWATEGIPATLSAMKTSAESP